MFCLSRSKKNINSDVGAGVYSGGLSCFYTHIGGAAREKGWGAAGLKDKQCQRTGTHYCLLRLFVLPVTLSIHWPVGVTR